MLCQDVTGLFTTPSVVKRLVLCLPFHQAAGLCDAELPGRHTSWWGPRSDVCGKLFPPGPRLLQALPAPLLSYLHGARTARSRFPWYCGAVVHLKFARRSPPSTFLNSVSSAAFGPSTKTRALGRSPHRPSSAAPARGERAAMVLPLGSSRRPHRGGGRQLQRPAHAPMMEETAFRSEAARGPVVSGCGALRASSETTVCFLPRPCHEGQTRVPGTNLLSRAVPAAIFTQHTT